MELTKQSELKEYFDENGYVVIDAGIDASVLDDIVESLSPYFGDNRIEPQGVPSSDYGRIQDAWYINQSVWKVAASEKVKEVLRTLYEAEPRPFQTLNFVKGTNQHTHSDSIHFNCEPFGMMCGVWVALEDIGPDQGPLRLYPKSNKLPEMNYPDFGLEASDKEYPKYLNALQNLIDEHGFEERRASIKKGQAVIWGANTLHGGAPQNNMDLSRYSQVTHYYMGNPKAWRPSQSAEGRKYFKPDEVRNMFTFQRRLYVMQIRARQATRRLARRVIKGR